MPDDELNRLKKRLSVLVNGFLGYTGPGARFHSFEVFKKYLYEKVRFFQKFLEKKHDLFTKTPHNPKLLQVFLESIRTFAKCILLLEKDFKRWPFLLEEIRLSSDEEESLYQQDMAILQDLSNIVDKISSFQISSHESLSDMHQHIMTLKTHLEEKENHMGNLNDILQAVTEDMQPYLKEIQEHTASAHTYEVLQKQIEKNPARWNAYQAIFDTFRNASKSYLSLSEMSLPHSYEQALVFLDAYAHFCQSLITFLEWTPKLSTEEQALWAGFKEKLRFAPSFTQESSYLKQGLRSAKARQTQRQQIERFLKLAVDAEAKLDFSSAIGHYEEALKFQPMDIECMQGIARNRKKQDLQPDLQQANLHFISMEWKQAEGLYKRILEDLPDFEEAKRMLRQIRLIQGGDNE